jgi:hypothetical protein
MALGLDRMCRILLRRDSAGRTYSADGDDRPQIGGRVRRQEPACRPVGRIGREGGMVVAETALALPALVLVVGLMLWAVLAVTTGLRCVDAARATARAAARGEGVGPSIAAGQRLAPAGAHITVTQDGELVHVRVRASTGLFGVAGLAPALTVSADAVVAAEPGCAGVIC